MNLNSSPLCLLKRNPSTTFPHFADSQIFLTHDTNDFFSFSNPSPPISGMLLEKNYDDHYHSTKLSSYKDPTDFFKDFSEEPTHQRHDSSKLNIFHDFITKEDDCQEPETKLADSPKMKIEETTSVSTKPSPAMDFNKTDQDCHSIKLEENLNGQGCSDVETRNKAYQLIKHKTKDEIEYIQSVLMTLLRSCREVANNSQEMELDSILEPMLLQLLESKKGMAEKENQSIQEIVDDEITEIVNGRPGSPIDEEELGFNKRKVKKTFKDNKNSSSLNHINENYVSNIFQFAKKNFPDDKEVRRIANERNVSASNFKKLMTVKLIDSAFTKRAKYRIMEGGRELLRNIEYWMNEGYFDQCNDREKYIKNKHKALFDLGLESRLEIETPTS